VSHLDETEGWIKSYQKETSLRRQVKVFSHALAEQARLLVEIEHFGRGPLGETAETKRDCVAMIGKALDKARLDLANDIGRRARAGEVSAAELTELDHLEAGLYAGATAPAKTLWDLQITANMWAADGLSVEK
jgi:hypothetical protein